MFAKAWIRLTNRRKRKTPSATPKKTGPAISGLEYFADLSRPPVADTLSSARWCHDVSARLLDATIRGAITRDRAEQIRATIRTVLASIPAQAVWEVNDMLDRETKGLKSRVTGVEPTPAAPRAPKPGQCLDCLGGVHADLNDCPALPIWGPAPKGGVVDLKDLHKYSPSLREGIVRAWMARQEKK